MNRKRITSLIITTMIVSLTVFSGITTTVKADTTTSSTSPGVTYEGHVQNVGWQPWVSDGVEAGTDGQGLRVEALKIKLTGTLPTGASIEYQGHVQNIGWQPVVSDGAEIGTDGQGLRVEAIRISLKNMAGYSVQYRTHVQNIGWQPWVSDGAEAGTDGQGLRVEALQIKIVPDTVVTFKDTNLEQAVRNTINKPTGTLYKNDVDHIINLNASTYSIISDISGIENLTNLENLDLDSNKISDISALSGLTNLKVSDGTNTVM